jgi:hypothetical protein
MDVPKCRWIFAFLKTLKIIGTSEWIFSEKGRDTRKCNKFKCDTISVTYTIFVYYYREVKEIVRDFNTAHKQNVSPNNPLTTRLYNKPKLHYISATANDATTPTASATTISAAAATTATTMSTQHRKGETGHNL